uniref:Uncharacterized protein n=1 Tax=Glossina brevipalpis TaxID=37001 RepID=A0A1A9WEB9_9MUSC
MKLLSTLFCSIIFYCFFSFRENEGKSFENMGLMNNLNQGLKFAGDMFGVRMAADVADLVVKAFSVNSKQENQENKKSNNQPNDTMTTTKPNSDWSLINSKLITGILRLVNFDVSKLGALALNTLIIVAQTIARAVLFKTNIPSSIDSLNSHILYDQNATSSDDIQQNDHQFYSKSEKNLFDRLVENPNEKLKQLLNDATDVSLTDNLIHIIEDYEKINDEGACLKLLVCKITPFIRNMQKAFTIYSMNKKQQQSEEEKRIVDESSKKFNIKSLFSHLPNLSEYQEKSETCEHHYLVLCNKDNI